MENYGLWNRFQQVEPPHGFKELALKIHDHDYVELVEKLSSRGGGWLDSDTYVSRGTWRAGLTALASAKDSVERTLSTVTHESFILARPPGHHAGRSGPAMGASTLGFCIFNLSALAALELADRGLVVGVLDFDLHHGNGTQEILYEAPKIYHVDIHQDPWTIYPGTGLPEDIGRGPGKGTKYNVIVAPGSGDDIYLEAARYAIGLLLRSHVEVLVVDMGFDAYRGDGLSATMLATSNTYHGIGEMIREELNPRVLIAILEGGYTHGLERGLPAFIAGILGERDPVEDEATESDPSKIDFLRENIRRLERTIES